ncbi:transposase, partial [Kocuria subflava]|nr:transposase [Kocuria subflava]
STTSSRSTPAPAKSRVDNYRSVNALAETVNGLYKTELIYSRPVWETASTVELATMGWVNWWNTQRLHEALDYRTPADVEAAYTHPTTTAPATVLPRTKPRTLQFRALTVAGDDPVRWWAGSSTVKTAPCPRPGEVAVRRPPWASARALEMVRPIPEPPWSRSRAVSPR